jgi:hypothetical protein
LARTITPKTKGNAKERPKDMQPAGTKEGRELVPLMVMMQLSFHPEDWDDQELIASILSPRNLMYVKLSTRKHPMWIVEVMLLLLILGFVELASMVEFSHYCSSCDENSVCWLVHTTCTYINC